MDSDFVAAASFFALQVVFYRSATGSAARDRTSRARHLRSQRCARAYAALEYSRYAERTLPARERLLTMRYDMDRAPHASWYKYTPERDLPRRFGIIARPQALKLSARSPFPYYGR